MVTHLLYDLIIDLAMKKTTQLLRVTLKIMLY